MSTSISPASSSRSQKLNGGRVRCAVYLPQEEAKRLEQEMNETGKSQSSIIAHYYNMGKAAIQKEESIP